jgi:hypothetical protein
VIAYKFTRRGGCTLFSTFAWPLPSATAPGAWVEIDEPLSACRSGLHLCRVADLPYWIGDELFEAEIDGEPLTTSAALVARRARLVRRIEAWNEPNKLAFAHGCVARARTSLASAAHPAESASAYAEEAARWAANGNHMVAAYAAALACAALTPSAQINAAFHLERAEQGRLLAGLLGL